VQLIHENLKKAKAFVFDVDGVMTDGSVIATEEGHFLRNFNIKDGYAIQHAVKLGYPIAIISGGTSKGVNRRFEGLGVKDIYTGQQHKKAAFEEFLSRHNLTAADIIYMGDDLPDYPLMKQVGVACCPADAAIDIQSICHYISPVMGGKGCVRDIIEKTLKVQEKWWVEESFMW
jgi:3-deoxy-D-manno-octulosonate 8-phosphate phosphatase (KDO 8-P phosphatase)